MVSDSAPRWLTGGSHAHPGTASTWVRSPHRQFWRLHDRAQGTVALVEPGESSYPCSWEAGMAEAYVALGNRVAAPSAIEVMAQKGEAAAEHVLKWVPNH
jgi:hypothetical protein